MKHRTAFSFTHRPEPTETGPVPVSNRLPPTPGPSRKRGQTTKGGAPCGRVAITGLGIVSPIGNNAEESDGGAEGRPLGGIEASAEMASTASAARSRGR